MTITLIKSVLWPNWSFVPPNDFQYYVKQQIPIILNNLSWLVLDPVQ